MLGRPRLSASLPLQDLLRRRVHVIGFFQFVGNIAERVRDNSVHNKAGAGGGLRGAYHPELELVSGKRER